MIDLINRRFVPFFYNTGGPGKGHDDQAGKFVADKVPNRWAFLSAFTPDGRIVGTSDIYADKNEVYEFLQRLLREFPEFAKTSAEEDAIFAAGSIAKAEPSARRRAASLAEELGRYEDAMKLWAALETEAPAETRLESWLARIRIRRSQRDWYGHQALTKRLQEISAEEASKEPVFRVLDHLAVEDGYRSIAWRGYSEARKGLQSAAREHASSLRAAELHFLAGVACWMSGDLDWAKFHWCFLAERWPEDRLYQRAHIAAAAEKMPYPNAELLGFASKGSIGPDHIAAEFERSKAIYRELLPHFEANDLRAKRGVPKKPAGTAAQGSAEALARKLVDGNEHVTANNKIVKDLLAMGEPAIDALVHALADSDFEGRGYAGFALGHVLAKTGKRQKAALDAMAANLESGNPYVVALTTSGRRALQAADAGTWEEPFQERK